MQDGVRWGCDASDHGPFCRLCVEIGEDRNAFPRSPLAQAVVDAIWYDLMGRSGFGSALDDAPDSMEDEIKADLVKIVHGVIQRSVLR